MSIRPLLPTALIALVLALGGFATGYALRGAELVALDPGLIGADPTPGPSLPPTGVDNDGVLEIQITEEGVLEAEGLTFTEQTGTLELVVIDNYPGFLELAIERDYGDGNFIVVYREQWEQGITGFGPLTVEQAGSYRISAIPGNPPLVASTATLKIAEPAAP